MARSWRLNEKRRETKSMSEIAKTNLVCDYCGKHIGKNPVVVYEQLRKQGIRLREIYCNKDCQMKGKLNEKTDNGI